MVLIIETAIKPYNKEVFHMKRYKKIIAAMLMAAAVTSAFPVLNAGAQTDTPTVAFGQEAQKCSLKNLKTILYRYDNETGTPILKKTRMIKKCFILGEDEALIIPKGVTMTLNGGAVIKGRIYVENGGKLILKRYTTQLYGSIVSDGVVSITQGTLTCFSGSLLYIGEHGTFDCLTGYDEETKMFSGQVSNDPQADIICVGKTKYNNPIFNGTPVAAVGYNYICDGELIEKLDKVDDPGKLLPGVVGYGKYSVWGDDYYDAYTVMFEGGGTVKYIGNPEHGWNYIDNVPVSYYTAQLNKYRDPSFEIDSIDEI